MSAYYNEIDSKAAGWLAELIKAGHLPAGDIDTRSIKDVDANDIRQYTQCHFFAGIGVWAYALTEAGWPAGKRVWTGSCPCFVAGTQILTMDGYKAIYGVCMMMSEQEEWARSLKVGDKVLVRRGYGIGRQTTVGVVEKVNKATVQVSGHLFNMSNRRLRGSAHYDPSCIFRATDEKIAEIEELEARRTYIRYIRNTSDLEELPTEKLEKIFAIIKDMK